MPNESIEKLMKKMNCENETLLMKSIMHETFD